MPWKIACLSFVMIASLVLVAGCGKIKQALNEPSSDTRNVSTQLTSDRAPEPTLSSSDPLEVPGFAQSPDQSGAELTTDRGDEAETSGAGVQTAGFGPGGSDDDDDCDNRIIVEGQMNGGNQHVMATPCHGGGSGPPNDPPIAVDDHDSTFVDDDDIEIDVMANDTDANGDVLTGVISDLQMYPVGGDIGPEHVGTVTFDDAVNPTSFIYHAPDPILMGINVYFKYKVMDARGAVSEEEAFVWIALTPNTPPAVGMYWFQKLEETSGNLGLLFFTYDAEEPNNKAVRLTWDGQFCSAPYGCTALPSEDCIDPDIDPGPNGCVAEVIDDQGYIIDLFYRAPNEVDTIFVPSFEITVYDSQGLPSEEPGTFAIELNGLANLDEDPYAQVPDTGVYTFDAGCTDDPNDDFAYTWHINSPPDSVIVDDHINPNGSRATIPTDEIGVYEMTVTVDTGEMISSDTFCVCIGSGAGAAASGGDQGGSTASPATCDFGHTTKCGIAPPSICYDS